jgi:hypothetical protein
MIFRY